MIRLSAEERGYAGPAATVADRLREHAAADPDRLALIFLDDGETESARFTYGALDRRIRALAAALQARGAAGERVLLLHPPGPEFVTSFYACLYAGAVAVPSPPPMANRAFPRVETIARDCRPALVMTTAEFQAKSQDQVARSPVLSGLPWLATDTIDDSGAGAWDGGPRSPDELAFLQYTSGSTAAPKGVMVSHGNLFANMRQLEVGMGHNEQTNVVSWLPLFHDMGLIGNLIHPLYLGTNCALMPPIRFIQKPIRWLRAVTRYRPHSSGGPNFAYDLCVEKTTPEEREGLDLSAWRVAFNGAEPIRAESMQAFATAFAPHGFRAEAHYPNYGLAEGTLAVTGSQRGMLPVVRGYDAAALEQHRAEPAAVDAPGGRSLVSSGHCVADADIAIADPESGARLADGAVGEIWVRGPNVAQGYWDRDEETAQTFRAHTTDGQGPYLRTGDLGFLDRGELFVTGRIKDMLIVHGRNVYPQDIERASEACHEAMVPTGAAAFCHTEDGSEHIVLVQEVTRHYRKYDLEGVVDAARAAVWGELEVPVQTVVLVKPGSNPKTSSGKIMRHQVMLSFRDGELPEVHRSDLTVAAKKATTQPPEGDRVTRTDDLGSYLRVKVAAALGQPVEQIDGARPIQSLGLDSLLAARLAHGVETELGITLPVTTFLRDITLDDLAGDLAIRLPQGTGGLPGPDDQRPPPLPLEPPREAPAMPLTRGQRALWFQYRLVPESPAYNITVSLRLLGSLDRGALQRGLDGLLARHPLLRGRVRQQRGEPVLAMDLAAAAHLERVDLTGQPAAAVEAALTASCRQPFDLTRGPLIRFCLFQRAPDDHVLVICVHHMICDGWSVNLLVQDLFRFYEQGRIEDDPPGAFIDVLGWQEGLLSGPQGDEGLAFWSDTLAGAPEEVTLPVARPRPPVQTFNGSSVPIALAADRLDRLRALAADCGATPYTVLLAAFRVLLHRYSGEGDVPVGTVMAGRRPVFEKTVGYFVNPVVLRTAVDGDLTGRDLIARVRETLHQALEHQNIPFPLLVERLHPRRNPARTPLFQIAFGLTKLAAETDDGFIDRPDPAHGFPAGSLRVLPFILPQQEGQFDLNLEFFETPERLFGRLNFNTDLFDPGVAARLAGHFDTLLSSLLDTPEAPVGTLPMLSAEELDGLDAWDALSARVPDPADFAGRTIHGLVAEQAARTPTATAVDPGDGGLTYADLEARANRLARHIAAAGVAPRGLVAVYLGRGPDMVVAVLAALKAGCAYLPVDPAYPADRVAFMLADSGAPVVVTDGAHVSALPPDAPRVLDLSAETAAIAAHPDTAPDTGVGEDDLAYVIYTSGSTGKPKGVMIPHRAACNRLRWKQRALDVGPADRVLQAIAYSFDPSVWEIFTPLIAGGCIVLPPPDIQRDPAAMAALMRDRGVTAFSCVPSLLQHLVDQPDFARIDTLRHVICGGESLPAPLAATFYQRTAATLDHFYGPTEATIYATHWPCPRDGSDGGKIPIGRPVAHAVVRILDGGGQPTPVGVPGELFIGGEGLARGYLNRPDLTETRFLPDPFAETPGARLYRTGDLGRFREDGAIEFLGRVDTQVKVRGFRVELEEVEVHLKACPGLRDAAVAARGPSGAERLVAYVVPNGDGTPVDAGAIRAFMLKRLPDYMVPGQVMALDALPLSPNGKVDRAALPQLDRQAANGGAEKVPPRDALETSLVRIWEDILDVRPVGIHDNFFDLGGHSLMALRIQTRIEKALAVTVPATALFETPTVAALAERLRRRQDSASARLLVEVQPAGDRRPFFCVAAGHGDVMRFASLSQHMGTGRPFMALVPPRGPDGKPPRLVLTDLAAEYVDEILTVQRDGPFLIAGFSLGGVVALEVARQITARGHRVGAMVLLDTVHPSWTRGSLMLFRAVKAFITRFGFGKDTVFSRWLKTIFTDPGLEGQLEAMGRHRVTPYPGPATLVMSKSNARWRWLLFRPWSAKVTALRITRIVDGWHGRMFREPYVTDLAGILNDSLDGAESGDGTSPRIH